CRVPRAAGDPSPASAAARAARRRALARRRLARRSVPQRQGFETAQALRVAVGRSDVDTGKPEAVVGVGTIGGERPRGEAREASLGVEPAARRPFEPELLTRRRAGVATDELGTGLERLRRLLPRDQLERVAAAVRAHALNLATDARSRLRAAGD